MVSIAYRHTVVYPKMVAAAESGTRGLGARAILGGVRHGIDIVAEPCASGKRSERPSLGDQIGMRDARSGSNLVSSTAVDYDVLRGLARRRPNWPRALWGVAAAWPKRRRSSIP
jgi:hypothetical protein